MNLITNALDSKVTWNKGKLVDQKLALKQKEIWSIGIQLRLGHHADQ